MNLGRLITGTLLACGLISTAAIAQTADTVYSNGKIYTVNEAQPWVEAVAIKDGKFIKVGSSDDMSGHIGAGTKVVDLGGKFAMPGLQDTHVHMEQAYIADMVGDKLLSFPPGTSVTDMQKMLKEYAEKNPDLEVLFAQGLPLSAFPENSPTAAFIDEVISDRPVFILTDTEHEGLLNSKAIELEALTAETPTPDGGEIVKDPKTGKLTGLLKETAAGKWAWKHYPDLTPEQHKEGLKTVIAYLNSVGVTSVKQQHAKNPIALAAQGLEKDGSLHMRIGLSWTWKGPLEPLPLPMQWKMIEKRGRFASDLIRPNFVKFSADGNAGTTGLVVDPYLVTGDSGISFFDGSDLIKEVELFDRMGMGVSIHATGDLANRQMIDAVEKVKIKYGELKARHQLAHATLIHPDDVPRLKALDITAEFSPVMWYPSDFPEAQRKQLGDERMSRWFPINSVAKSGARFVFASDGPLFWHDPLVALETVVTRQVPGGGEKALNPHEAIDLATAIEAVTLNAAYLIDQESVVGSIEENKHADMIVLDQNLFEVKSTEIGKTKVMLTIFDGKVVYDAAKDPTGEKAIEASHKVEIDLTGKAGSPYCEWHILDSKQ